MSPTLNYRLIFDGVIAGNPRCGGLGIVLINPDGLICAQISHPLEYEPQSVYISKYLALQLGLFHLQTLNPLDLGNLEVVSDSRLLIGQLRGIFPIENPDLKKLYSKVIEYLKEFPSYTITFLPRKYNRLANSLAHNAITST